MREEGSCRASVIGKRLPYSLDAKRGPQGKEARWGERTRLVHETRCKRGGNSIIVPLSSIPLFLLFADENPGFRTSCQLRRKRKK